jgi:hypothetical protein
MIIPWTVSQNLNKTKTRFEMHAFLSTAALNWYAVHCRKNTTILPPFCFSTLESYANFLLVADGEYNFSKSS